MKPDIVRLARVSHFIAIDNPLKITLGFISHEQYPMYMKSYLIRVARVSHFIEIDNVRNHFEFYLLRTISHLDT